jgi:SAM-dependent methyltransferase
MSFSAERAYYENAALWEPDLYQAEQTERALLTASWLPADVHSVLDAGCGNGVLTNQLTQTGRIVGVDRSFAALQWVRPDKCQSDLAALPFADNSFDALVSTEVLEHLPVFLYGQALDEMVRVTRRYLLVSVPYCEELETGRVTCPYCGCRFHRNYHMRSFTQPAMQTLFSHHPSVTLVRAAGIFTQMVSGTERILQSLQRIDKRLNFRRSAFASDLICPQCNYTRPALGSTSKVVQQRARRRPRLGPILNRMIPAKQTYRWWLALYEKK